jgi:hypothetical protein
MVNKKLACGLHRKGHAGVTPAKNRSLTMRYSDSRDPYQKPSPLGRFGSWLSRRPVESWGFFIAGFLIARIVF